MPNLSAQCALIQPRPSNILEQPARDTHARTHRGGMGFDSIAMWASILPIFLGAFILKGSRTFVLGGISELEFMEDVTLPPQIGGFIVHISSIIGLLAWAFGVTTLCLALGMDTILALTAAFSSLAASFIYMTYVGTSLSGAPKMLGIAGPKPTVPRVVFGIPAILLNIHFFVWGLGNAPWTFYVVDIFAIAGPIVLTAAHRSNEDGWMTPSVEVSA
jgi:hypothetical protein